ncbi:hypothetical protein [Streptomyces sp. NPDC058665]|uniref:hypothetical protein n=1 Tax=Streptomyces sp. NPDC058665 TaxID=3346586 RepID=UPI00365D9C7E
MDAFAGPGRYEDNEEGSPVFTLHRLLDHGSVARMGLTRNRVQLVFIEKQRDRYEYLLGELGREFGARD